MLEIEDVGRDQAVGHGKPPLGIGFAIVRHDQVEIEHPPFERSLAKRGAVEEHGAAGGPVLGRNSCRDGGDARVDRLGKLSGDELPQLGHGDVTRPRA